MANQVDIANGALVKLGAQSILSLDDGTKSSKIIKIRFEPCKQAVLRMHPWNFAMDRDKLAPLTETPAFGFANKFQLPANCLRVWKVNDRMDSHRLEGRNILSNDATIKLRYVKNVSESEFDPVAADALSAYLAWDICLWITQSETLKQVLWNDFLRILAKARFIDASEEASDELEESTIEDSATNPSVGGWVRDPMT